VGFASKASSLPQDRDAVRRPFQPEGAAQTGKRHLFIDHTRLFFVRQWELQEFHHMAQMGLRR